MAKLVIYTQHKENYSDDASRPYWKNKGGDVYIVEGLSDANVSKIEESGIPNLTKLIERADDFFIEYIVGFKIVEDDAVVCEEWESPIMLSYNKHITHWTAKRVTNNDEFGYMRKEIKRKTETWDLEEDGSYRCSYTVEGYGVVGHANMASVLKQLDQKSVA